jgi:CMP-N,N'-diacetyllegionaminic acid synthase
VKVLGLIPARGGSKGIPGKNLKELAGKPLLQWTVESAQASAVLDRLVLTTEDPRIAALGEQLGVDVPFLRPKDIASDTAAMIDVVLHAVHALAEEGYHPDALVLLQPTSPLRTAEHLRAAIELLEGVDAVCSVAPLPKELCPHYVMRITDSGELVHFLPEGAAYTRRQDVPQAYRRDGSIYLVRTQALLSSGSLYGRRCAPLVLPPEQTLTLDEPQDWVDAEQQLVGRQS